MLHNKIILFIVLSFGITLQGQSIVPNISARVDTTNVEIKKVYNLYKNYLNSRPDSIYQNPQWNKKESEYYLKNKFSRVDRAAHQMFNQYNSVDYFSFYKPKILQIDKIDENRFQIKTIFMSFCENEEYKTMTPSVITKLYAVKDVNNEYKLENAINYDTRNWKTYQYKFIKYVVHPSCTFNKKEAKKAIQFCTQIIKQFDLKNIEILTYYITPNSDEMGKLYNFEYWLSYLGGQTNKPLREIFTAYGNENYPHEFVHILFPLPKDTTFFCPMIVNEGLATWLAGPSRNETFEQALKSVSKTFKKQKNISLEDIMTFKFRNEFDNSILYVTGGVICKLVFEKRGKEGILELYNCNKENFKSVLEKLFGMPYEKIDILVIEYITNFKNIT